MDTLLINPPYQTITSHWGVGHQVPLGLLMVGGALRDAGFPVSLLDAEAGHLTVDQVAELVRRRRPEVVMTGHAGSTPAHPVSMALLAAVKRAYPPARTVYGGVFPTYHDRPVLRQHPQVDVVVRGEGEATGAELLAALRDRAPLSGVAGISYRGRTGIVRNPDRAPIRELNGYRTGWELVEDWDRYQCFGRGRAATVQLSRGCPHRCTYCGQHGFWQRWRYRDPVGLAGEIRWLHDAHRVRFVTLADENPTTRRDVWLRFLAAVAEHQLDIGFFATLRATDIVRDADQLDLYRRAGIRYVLLGIDSTDPETIARIRKRSSTRDDYQACRLLREHGIHQVIGHIVGFADETRASLRSARRALAAYDGDYLNVMYATPHRWTRFAQEQADRPVVQEDLGRWDYRHQVLGQRHLSPWRLFAAVKWLELCYHLRPRRLRRLLLAGDRRDRQEAWWTTRHTTLVWLMEIVEFVRRVRFARQPRPLRELTNLGPPESSVSAANRAGTGHPEREGTGRQRRAAEQAERASGRSEGHSREGADDGSLRGLQQRLLARL